MSIVQISTCSVCPVSSTYSMTKFHLWVCSPTTRKAGTWRCILSRSTRNIVTGLRSLLLSSSFPFSPLYSRGGLLSLGLAWCCIPAKSLQPAEPLSLSLERDTPTFLVVHNKRIKVNHTSIRMKIFFCRLFFPLGAKKKKKRTIRSDLLTKTNSICKCSYSFESSIRLLSKYLASIIRSQWILQ